MLHPLHGPDGMIEPPTDEEVSGARGPTVLSATDTVVVLPSEARATIARQGCLASDRDD